MLQPGLCQHLCSFIWFIQGGFRQIITKFFFPLNDFSHLLSWLELKPKHCWYIEPRNREKSLRLIWQRFSCLLDEWIAKIWKKLNSHGGFLRADQGRAKMCCQMGWIGCSFLQVAQKDFFGIFSSSRHEKRCQILQTLFWTFQYSRNSQWCQSAKW